MTGYDYDDCEQLTAVYQPGYPRPIRMKHDSFENLLEMTNAANQTTRYRYDILNVSFRLLHLS